MDVINFYMYFILLTRTFDEIISIFEEVIFHIFFKKIIIWSGRTIYQFGRHPFIVRDIILFFIDDQGILPLDSERLIFCWFVGTSKGETAGMRDLILLYTQCQWSNPRQLVKGENESLPLNYTPQVIRDIILRTILS